MRIPEGVVLRAQVIAAALVFTAGLGAQDAGTGDGDARESPGTLRHAADSGRSVTLELPAALAKERGSYEREVLSAMEQVSGFFRRAGLEVPAGGTVESVMVFESAAGARKHLADAYGISPGDIPETFSGTVDGKMLFLVSRESYEGIWTNLYRGWPWTDTTYRGLIVHELAHKAHEAIAVSRRGSSEAMGPVWFFEGLAVACAGQFDSAAPPMTPGEIGEVAGSGRTPEPSYPLYGRLVRSLSARFAIRELIDRASEKKFPELLWSR